MTDLATLFLVFAYLSLLTVGGGMAAFPAMHVLAVDVHHWLTFPQLVHLYAVGQLAPGPNMMMVVPIGDWVGGLPGALVVLFGFFGPTALLTFMVGRGWHRLEAWPWRPAIENGLAPVSIGLLLAGCFTMAKGAIIDLDTAAIAVAVLLVLQRYKINPALLVIGSAVLGLLSFE
ncbi:chromate transporter [Roseomonas sp. CAU 1739]|uniref:chromate transporter n=1 Tax=Roseomonas sp. CAU 1739 TaxID=3140364 RepID=UPI00325C22F8